MRKENVFFIKYKKNCIDNKNCIGILKKIFFINNHKTKIDKYLIYSLCEGFFKNLHAF